MKKNFCIIGGTSGIGKAIGLQLASEENNVIVQSREMHDTSHPNITFHECDVMEDKISFKELEEPLNGLVYAPGTIRLRPFKSLKPDDFYEDWKLNFLGAVKTVQFYLPQLLLAKNASVVLFSTVAVQTGMNFHSSIASAKGAVEGLVRSLAAEFAPKIRVNAIAPSLTETPLATSLLNSEAKRNVAIERHPLKRVGTAAEVASLSCWLLSDQAAFVTGAIFKMDGGMSALR